MPIMTPEEIEGLRRAETINAALSVALQRAGIAQAMRGGSYPDEGIGDGFYDDTTGAWTEWFKAGDLAGVNPVMP